MSELSHPAKEILVAEAKSRCLREECGCHPNDPNWTGCWICVHRKGVAAALRALAKHCKCDDGEGYWIYCPNILAIAKELEAQ